MSAKAETTPIGKAALKIGVSSVVTAAVLAIGSLAYYGLGLSSQASALDHIKTGRWPEEAKAKIQATYMYLFFSFYICVISAFLVFSDEILFRIFSSPAMVLIDFLVQRVVDNGKLFAQMNTEGIFSVQRLTWIVYCTFLGGVASSAFLLGVKTARISIHLTCLMVSSLVILSLIAPSEKYVTWKFALSFSEIVVFVSSIGAAVFPIDITPGAIFFTLSFYGGLILYPANFLLHSQEAQISASEDSPENPFCAITMSIPMLLDAISIFSRIVVMVPPY